MDTLKIAVLIIIAILLIYIVIFFIKLIISNNKVKKSFTQLNLYMKKRWNLIPNLIEKIKSSPKIEKQMLEEMILLRNTTYDNMSDHKKLTVDAKFSKYIPQLLTLIESSSELKENPSIVSLYDKMTKLEERISSSREYYVRCSTKYNDMLKRFPLNLLAKVLKYESKEEYSFAENGDAKNRK